MDDAVAKNGSVDATLIASELGAPMAGNRINVVDDFGVKRELVDDGDRYRGEITVDGEPMKFWMPRDVVEGWQRRMAIEDVGDEPPFDFADDDDHDYVDEPEFVDA